MSAIPAGYKQTEVGVIPEDWVVAQINNLGEVKRGAGSQYVRYSSESRGVRFIRINDFFEDNPVFVHAAKEVMRFCIDSRDILFAGTGNSAGASYIPDSEWIGLPHSYNAPRIRVNNNVSKHYILYSLQSGYLLKQQSSLFVGAAQPFLDTRAIKGFYIACPPTKVEQRAIAAALSDVDALLAKLDQFIAKKRDLKQAAMQQLLTGQTRLPGFGGAWEVRRLGDVASATKGSQLHSSESSDSGRFAHLNGGISPSGYTEAANMPGGTIAISEGGNSCGHVQFMPEPYWCGGHCYSVIPHGIDNGFLYHALKGQQTAIMALRVGSGLPNVQKTALLNFSVSFPVHGKEQTAIATVLSDMDTELAALEARRDKTRALKQGMMQELLTGRIRLV